MSLLAVQRSKCALSVSCCNTSYRMLTSRWPLCDSISGDIMTQNGRHIDLCLFFSLRFLLPTMSAYMFLKPFEVDGEVMVCDAGSQHDKTGLQRDTHVILLYTTGSCPVYT